MTMREESGGVDPVFLDPTGKRRRLFVAAGSAGGLLLLVAVVALIAGFTGSGPGSVPGWPDSGKELRISRLDSAVSVQSATTAPEPAATTKARPADRPTAPVTTAAVTTAPEPSSAAPSVSPSAPVNPHRRVPAHAPGQRKKKDK